MIYLIKDAARNDVLGYVTSLEAAKLIMKQGPDIFGYQAIERFNIKDVLAHKENTARGRMAVVVGVKIDDIIAKVSEKLGLKPNSILSDGRKFETSQIRAMIGYLLRGEGCTLQQTATLLHRKDHTTVKNWKKMVAYGLEYDDWFQKTYAIVHEIFHKYKKVEKRSSDDFS